MDKLIALMFAAMMAVGLSACETTKGLGKDLEKLGEKIEEAVE